MNQDLCVAFVQKAAQLVKDGECLSGEHVAWDMPGDHAYEVLHELIDEARAIAGYESIEHPQERR